MKKLSLIILALLLSIGSVWAQDTWPKTWISGSTTCTLTEDSVFTVTPTDDVSGAMEDYDYENQNYAPWYQDYCSINAVVIGNGVTHVGNQSFNSIYAVLIHYTYTSRIKSVTFSNDVVSIGDAAFFGCELQTITIPDHVVTIGTRAFGGCNNASSIHIGAGVTTLGSYAFTNCDNVQNLYIGQSVTTLGENCFEWSCYNADIECHAAPFSTWVSSDEDFTASAEDRGRFHVAFVDYSAWKAAYPSTGCVIIPDLDTEIHWTSGNCALDLDGYGTLTISGNGAMADYNTTTDCPWNNADIISKVNRVIVKDGVTTLSNNGFTGFTNVTDVVFLFDMLTAWPSCATDFASTTKCYVSYEWTGHYTNALAQLFFTCGYGMDWTLDTNGTLTISKTLPGSGLFYDFQSAEQLPWHDHVSEISYVALGDSVRDIGSYVFSGIHASTITIAESVTHIKSHAFDGSTTQFFTVPTSVTQIDAYTFANSGLYTFEIPSFMTQIPEGLFKDCHDLTRVTFNEGITSIGKNAFYNAGLTEVDLPSTLTTIGENAFNGCTDVTDIYCGITNPNALSWTSYQTDFNQNADFHVFSGSFSQWQSRFPNALVNFVEDEYGPDNPFEIYTSADWATFCNMVQTISPGICAKLMADIDLGNLDNMVGTENKMFSGTFDGNGHSITLLVDDLDCKYFTYGSICRYLLEKAPFMYIHGATIKNLHILGSMETGQVDYTEWTVEEQSNLGSEYTSGLVSHASGNNYISNCHSGLQFVIYHHTKNDFISGDHSGLFVGEVASGSTTTITNCLFDGVIDWGRSSDTQPKPSKNGGFVGCNRGTVTIANSLFAPSAVGFDNDDANYTFVCNVDNGSHQLYDCYYTRKFDNVQGTSASGWSQWHLSASLGSEWTLDRYSTAMPVMAEHELAGQGTLGNPYLIADADDWAYLARTVNGTLDLYSDKYIKMTGDISTNIPVGFLASNRPFCGHFDGDGHTLNVDITFSDEYTAPFGCISGATIEGLVVTGAVRGGNHSAGLVGTVTTDSGNNYIQDCKVLTTVITTGNYAGGILGDGASAPNHIMGCRFDGSITKAVGIGSYAGALMGWCTNQSYQHIEGCFVTGTLSNFDHMGMNYDENSSPKVFGGTNCYHTLDPDYYNENLHAYSITSGTQGLSLTNQDNIPSYGYNPVSGINFYSHGMMVDGMLLGGPDESFCLALIAPEGFAYSNPMANGVTITPGHSGDLYGYNIAIDEDNPVNIVVTATLTLTGDPIHEINTVDDWNTFAYTVSNGCYNYSSDTVNLNADLCVTEMVGRSGTNSFQGTFEGNGHTLTFNANTSEQLCAPFRWIKNATFQHLYTTGTINTSNQMAAGIVGRAFGNCSLIDCRSNMEIVSSKNGDGTHGGLVAVVNHEGSDPSNISLMTFEGCLFDGKLLTTNGTTNGGGFVGYSHSNRVQFLDCVFHPAEVTASMGGATFGRSADASTCYVFDNAYYFTAFGTVQGKQAHSITVEENLSIDFSGSGIVHNISGIIGYGTGIKYNDVLYAGNGVNVSLEAPAGFVINTATYTPEGGSPTPVTPVNGIISFTMPDANVTINATLLNVFTKEILAHAPEGQPMTGWYLIASPIGTVAATAVTNLADNDDTNNFDLYRFNQAADLEWENWKQTANDNGNHYQFNLEAGRGYLYANASNVTLVFTGTPYDGNGQVTLNKTANVPFEGWNLVGNPFAATAYIDRPFYTMNETGSEIMAESTTGGIGIMQGVFVIANYDEEPLTFSKTAPINNSQGALNINVMQTSNYRSGNSLIDRAIVSFGEGCMLPKFQLFEGSTKIYIPLGNEDYAIVSTEKQGEMPLNFEATEDGTYTLSVNPEGIELAYLHLIDNLTGADVDLLTPPAFGHPLSEGEAQSDAEFGEATAAGRFPLCKGGQGDYTFTAKTTDYASRFRLVFAPVSEDADGDNEDFAFISNGNIIVNGEGMLQVMDVMGRVIRVCTDGVHTVSTSGMPAGVYVLRLINGENVRTQKVIVN